MPSALLFFSSGFGYLGFWGSIFILGLFSNSLSNVIGISIVIALNLETALDKMDISTRLILPIHELGMPCHFCVLFSFFHQ